MVLQKIIWDDTEEYGSREMFFRVDCDRGERSQQSREVGMGALVNQDSQLIIPAGESVSFNTYFNLFSVRKWREHTAVRELSVCLKMQGEGHVSLVGIDRDGPAMEHVICEMDYNCPVFGSVVVCKGKTLADLHDFCFVRVTAAKTTAILDGGYGTEDEPVNDVKLACCICTYKREEYVKRNIQIVLHEIIDNPYSPLHGKLEVFVADNGNTLPVEMFRSHPGVHIRHNKNYGGSAGFARNMIEAAIYRADDRFSHLILMDDDILLYPQVLERTYMYLCMLKEDYRRCILGGAMLLLEKKDIQAEACGKYSILSGSNEHNYKRMLDLSRLENIVYNECDEDANFSGWWYSCIPTSVIQADNLPLPMFLHRDDQEYGIRTGKKILQLNGICIWHPSPAGKHSDFIYYYDMRNMLIADMNHYQERISGKHLKKLLAVNAIQCCLGYRYNSALMNLRGCEDFCRGIGYFKSVNPEKLHSGLLKDTNRQWVDVPGDIPSGQLKKVQDEKRIGTAVKLWRYLFPSSKTCYAEAGCNYPSYLGHKKVIYLNDRQDKGYLLAPSWGTAFRVMGKLIKVCRLIDREYNKACREWEDGIDELKSLGFWERYLGL